MNFNGACATVVGIFTWAALACLLRWSGLACEWGSNEREEDRTFRRGLRARVILKCLSCRAGGGGQLVKRMNYQALFRIAVAKELAWVHVPRIPGCAGAYCGI